MNGDPGVSNLLWRGLGVWQRIMARSFSERLRQLGLAEAVLDATLDAIVIIDESGVIQLFNPAAEQAFGYESAEVIGQNVSMLMPSPYKESHDGYIDAYLKTGDARVVGSCREVEARRKDGTTLWVNLALSEGQVGEQRYFIGNIRDLTVRKSYEVQLVAREVELRRALEDMEVSREQAEEQAARMVEMAEELATDKARLARQEEELTRYIQDLEMTRGQFESQASEMAGLAEEVMIEKEKVEASRRIIEHQACHDPLTDLGNRALMGKVLPEMLDNASKDGAKVGFVYIDLDNFKPVNDRLGHDAGDKLLCNVADALRQIMDERDEAIRLGGDEFAILVWLEPGKDRSDLRAYAERILKALTIPIQGDDFVIETGASIGTALYPDDGTNVDTVLTAADNAMYEAKRAGKGRIC